MGEKIHTTRDKCRDYEFASHSMHKDHALNLIDGIALADIWIIGLNAKNNIGNVEKRHLTFRYFKKVSEKLYENWERCNRNIALIDLVKSYSEILPSKTSQRNQRQVTDDSLDFLKKQILKYKPKVIICNGSPVCWEILRMIPPQDLSDLESLTSYSTSIDGHILWIVLSGFIGRIDNRNKRRLGMEIEQIIEKENIKIE